MAGPAGSSGSNISKAHRHINNYSSKRSRESARENNSNMSARDNVHSDDEDDDELISPKGVGTAFRREILDLQLLLMEDETDTSRALSYNSLTAPVGMYPSRVFCVICGMVAKYRCCKCAAMRPLRLNRPLCSLKCQKVHEISDCQKSKLAIV